MRIRYVLGRALEKACYEALYILIKFHNVELLGFISGIGTQRTGQGLDVEVRSLAWR